MRKYQIEIKMTMVTEKETVEKINVYADSNNAWETVCAGFHELVDGLQKDHNMELPSFGAKEHRATKNKIDS